MECPLPPLRNGNSIAKILKAVGYDAISPGNHDFNYGYERLDVLSHRAGVKPLAANVTIGGKNAFDKYLIKRTSTGSRLVCSAWQPLRTAYKTNPKMWQAWTSATKESLIATAQQMVDELQERDCDVIIALCHLGVDPHQRHQIHRHCKRGGGHRRSSMATATPSLTTTRWGIPTSPAPATTWRMWVWSPSRSRMGSPLGGAQAVLCQRAEKPPRGQQRSKPLWIGLTKTRRASSMWLSERPPLPWTVSGRPTGAAYTNLGRLITSPCWRDRGRHRPDQRRRHPRHH